MISFGHNLSSFGLFGVGSFATIGFNIIFMIVSKWIFFYCTRIQSVLKAAAAPNFQIHLIFQLFQNQVA